MIHSVSESSRIFTAIGRLMCTRIEVGPQHHGPMLPQQKLNELSQNESLVNSSSQQLLLLNGSDQNGTYTTHSHNYPTSSQLYSGKLLEKTEVTSPTDGSYQSFRRSSSDSAAMCGFVDVHPSNINSSDANQENYRVEQDVYKKSYVQKNPAPSLQQYHSPPPYDPVGAAVDFAKFESAVHKMTSNKIDICAVSSPRRVPPSGHDVICMSSI